MPSTAARAPAIVVYVVTREASAEGEDYSELLQETSREIEAAIISANQLNTKYPNQGVSWRDFRPIGEGAPVQPTVSVPAAGDSAPAPEGGA